MNEIRTQHSSQLKKLSDIVVGRKGNEILACVAQVTTCTHWHLSGNVKLQRPNWPRRP